MPTFVVCNRHEPEECRFVFAAFKGFDSPLRHRPTVASCHDGDHTLWWRVEAADREAALAQLPPYLAARSDVTAVSEVTIP